MTADDIYGIFYAFHLLSSLPIARICPDVPDHVHDIADLGQDFERNSADFLDLRQPRPRKAVHRGPSSLMVDTSRCPTQRFCSRGGGFMRYKGQKMYFPYLCVSKDDFWICYFIFA